MATRIVRNYDDEYDWCGTEKLLYWLHWPEIVWHLIPPPPPPPGPDDIIRRTFGDILAHLQTIAITYNMPDLTAALEMRKLAHKQLTVSVQKLIELNPQPEPPATSKPGPKKETHM